MEVENDPRKKAAERMQRQQELLDIYQNDDYQTLYRYDNPTGTYEEWREGEVSKKEFIGQWYTDSAQKLGEYILMRPPGGSVLVTRVPKSDLEKYNTFKMEETRGMDMEPGNYIIPPEIAQIARLDIPFNVPGTSEKRFQLKDSPNIRNFVQAELSDQAILKKIEALSS